MVLKLVFLIFFFFGNELTLLNTSEVYNQVIHVDSITGEDLPLCWNSTSQYTPCLTVMYALQGAKTQNSTLVSINTGVYNLNESYVFQNLSDFALLGNESNVTINCSLNSGLVFMRSENILVKNIAFSNCGYAIDDICPSQTAALAFIGSFNVALTNVNLINSIGTGTVLYGCKGTISILNSQFSATSSVDRSGGVSIMITENSTHVQITNCIFLNNFPITRGGAVSVIFQNSAYSSVSFQQCVFENNTATTGGALYVEFDIETSNSKLVTNGCEFSRNHASDILVPKTNTSYMIGGGGGIAVYYSQLHLSMSTDNSVNLNNSSFSSNKAITGAGVYFLIEHVRVMNMDLTPVLSLLNCTFSSNEANTGAAIAITSLESDREGFVHRVTFNTCKFMNNFVTNDDGNSGVGAFFIQNLRVEFNGMMFINNNAGTAVVLTETNLQIMSNTHMTFSGNTGYYGGAIALYGQSSILISDNTSIQFLYNSASGLGGAIYHTGYVFHQIPQRCFIQYINERAKPSFNISFEGNQAREKINSIYTNAISSCMIMCQQKCDIDLNIFCQQGWSFSPGNCTDEIESVPSLINISPNTSDTFKIYSGVQTSLPIVVTDFFGHNITNDISLRAVVDKGEAIIDPISGIISNNDIKIYAHPNSVSYLTLQTNEPPFVELTISMNTRSCPPGFLPTSQNTNQTEGNICVCSKNAFFSGAIECNNNTLTSQLIVFQCMSNYDNNETSLLVAGVCPFLVSYATQSSTIALPTNPSEVEESICGRMNRKGVLCGVCKAGYGLAVYSYSLECVKCNGTKYNWLLYLLAQYLPITIIFVLITIFNLGIVSPASNAFLFFSQITSVSDAYIFSNFISKIAFGDTVGQAMSTIYITLYGIWNLDIFRALIPPICLQEQLSTVYVIFFSYIAAFYPLLLVLFTYLLITLYDRNCLILVWIWKPFKYCMSKFKTKFEPRTSLIDAFATFFVLSYTKILGANFRMFRYVFVYDINGNILETVFYYDATIKMFQGVHLPFGILAIVTFMTIVIAPPILLTCYQFKWFQKLLEKLHLRTHALIAFVEIFQSGFTDGRNGTKDRRYFAGMYFILRILLFAPETVSAIVFVMIVLPLFVYIIAIFAFAAGQPYRIAFYNKLDTFHFAILIVTTFLFIVAFFLALSGVSGGMLAGIIGLTYLLGFLPLLYIISYVGWRLFKNTKIFRGKCYDFEKYDDVPVENFPQVREKRSSSLFSAPDRILQPEAYQSLNITDTDEEKDEQETPYCIYTNTDEQNRQYGSTLRQTDYSASDIQCEQPHELTVELSTYSN